MESVTADLVSDDTIVFAGLTARIAVGPAGKWAGTFELPRTADRLSLENYQLASTDGRSGTIKIDRVSVSPNKTEFWFTGVGAFR